MLDLYWTSLIVFAGALALFFWFDRHNVERQSILLLRKTQRGKQLIKGIGLRFPRFWKVLGTLGVLIGFYFSLQTLYSLASLFIQTILTAMPVPGVSLVLPAPTAIIGDGFIGVPVWYWIISIAVLVIVHEGLHGIIAASQKVRLKSLGWGLLVVIPLAFVEPDEKQINNTSSWTQLRVYAAGSFANFIVAFFIILLVLPYAFSPFMAPVQGAKVYPIVDYPFANSQLAGITDNYTKEYLNIIITDMNGRPIGDSSELTSVINDIGIKPGDSVGLGVDVYYGSTMEHVDIEIVAAENPNNETRGYIGISFDSISISTNEIMPAYMPARGLIMFITQMFVWVALINMGVGMFNLLPIGPLDGGKMWSILFKRLSKRHHRLMSGILSYATLIILLGILLPAIASNFI